MKSYVLLLCLIFRSIGYQGQVQNRFLNNGASPVKFNTIQSQAKAYFNALPDTSKDGADEEFGRWEYFWKSRVGTPDSTNNGTFLPAYKALYAQLQSPICNTGTHPASWVNLGPGIIPLNDQAIGIVISVAFDPISPTITYYAGTNCSGLWKTTNGGANWTCLTDYLRLPGLGINSIAINPNNSGEIYIATGISRVSASYGLGIYKSSDGGQSWQATGLSFTPSNGNSQIANKIIVDPTSPNNNPTATIAYAAIENKLYKTTDGGANWAVIHTIPASTFFQSSSPCVDPFTCTGQRSIVDIEFSPGNPNTVYISTNDQVNAAISCVANCGNSPSPNTNGGAELWKSTDAGATWVELTPVTTGSSPLYITSPNIIYSDKIEIAVTPSDPNSLYISYGHSNNGGNRTLKSVDGGVTWGTPMPSPGIVPFNISPVNANNFYTGALNAYKSIDAGLSWVTVSDYFADNYVLGGHGDVRAFAIANNNGGDAVLMGNDGGVSYIAAGNPPWANVSKTLPITQFYGLASSEKNPNIILAGTQDNGVFTYNNGSWVYQVTPIGDAYDCAFDYNDPSVCYAEGNGGFNALHKSINGGGTTFGGCNQPAENSNRVRPIENNASNKNIYIGYQNIYKAVSDNLSNPTWVTLSDFVGNFGVSQGAKLTAIAVAPSDSNVIYVAFDGPCGAGCTTPSNYFFKTTVGGGLNLNDWQDITNAAYSTGGALFKWINVTSIAINPTNPNDLWITADGIVTGGLRVFHSGNGGVSWFDYSTGLPNFPANKIVYEKGSNDGLYVATDVGVFYRNKTMAQWECFNDQLPVCIVTDLEINYASNSIRAATYGRGIWQSSLACPLTANITDNTAYGFGTVFLEAKNNITSASTVANSAMLTYRAGNYVNLKPGFGANSNSFNTNFHAFIHNCDMPGNSFRINPNANTTPLKNDTQQAPTSKKASAFSVYPNPNDGTFTIDIANLNFNTQNTIEIYDMYGRLLLTKNNVKADELFNLEVKNGMYLVKYVDGKNTYSQKVVIQN